jgi:hypothetical protein
VQQDGSMFAISDWEEFEKSRMWSAILFELEERDKFVMELLRYGDPDQKWSDSDMRSRLNELEYMRSIPKVMANDIRMQQLNASKDEDNRNNTQGE